MVRIAWNLPTAGEEKLTREARDALAGFLRYASVALEDVQFIVRRIERGSKSEKLVEVAPDQEDTNRSCLLVRVKTHGGQKLVGALSVRGMKKKKLRHLVAGGPYNVKPRTRFPVHRNSVYLLKEAA